MRLSKQVVKPRFDSSNYRTHKDKDNNRYNECPSCKGTKRKDAELCWNCKMWSRRPPIIYRTFVVSGAACRLIPLTRGQYALVYKIDYEWLMKKPWVAAWNPSTETYYAVTANDNPGKPGIRMNVLIAGKVGYRVVHHHNHDTLDNRRSNLKPCTHSQNSMSRKIHSNNTSGYRGVSFDKSSGKWMVQIGTAGKRNQGRYKSAIEAARLYDKLAIKLYGEFAMLNFPVKHTTLVRIKILARMEQRVQN